MSAPVQEKIRVMVVDDDPVVLEVARVRLEGAGYEVICRGSPLGTSAAIMRMKPSVVLLDVGMPGLAGDTIAELLRTNAAVSNTAVILHSSEERRRLYELAHRCGAAG